VLTVTGLVNAEYLISSVALSIDEYYAGVGESPGVWAGRWAEGLGLAGVVDPEDLRALVEGRHPETGAELLAGSRKRSVLAFDLTFSAPKSVSLLWALGTAETARVLADAHREAVGEALGFLEERAAVARVQAKGVRRRAAASGWAVAGSFIGPAVTAILSCILIVWSRTWSGGVMAGMSRLMPARCMSGPGRPARCTRTTCNGP
jgi:conjugative relaxase-like TrwC/TraI family protein